MMRRAAAYLRLVRPVNLLITAAGVCLGAALSLGAFILPAELVDEIAAACASAVLIAAGGNGINDLFDLRTDRVNRPNRPLPSGEISPMAARGIWIIATVAGVVLASFVSFIHFGLALLAAALLYLYSARLKGMPFAGNLTIALLVALAIVYGGWAVGSPTAAYVGAGFALLTTFARELIKDIEDIPGDRLAEVRTAPIAFGAPVVRNLSASMLILTVLLTPLPFLALDYGHLFLFLVLVADLMLLRVIWLLPHSPAEARDASSWLKSAMVMGIAALFAA